MRNHIPLISKTQFAELCQQLPTPQSRRGRRPIPNQELLPGILYVLKTGCAWEDLPPEYGSDTTCWRRLNEWSQAGTWERIWRAFLSELDAQTKLEWAQAFLDGSFVPAKKGAME